MGECRTSFLSLSLSCRKCLHLQCTTKHSCDLHMQVCKCWLLRCCINLPCHLLHHGANLIHGLLGDLLVFGCGSCRWWSLFLAYLLPWEEKQCLGPIIDFHNLTLVQAVLQSWTTISQQAPIQHVSRTRQNCLVNWEHLLCTDLRFFFYMTTEMVNCFW